jgi:hypothetical protein
LLAAAWSIWRSKDLQISSRLYLARVHHQCACRDH